MINAICVQNFRSIKDVTVQLGPLNVVLGRNGAGKSNFLDSLAFLADVTEMGVRAALLRENRRGFEDVVYAGERHQIIAFQIEAWNNRLGFPPLASRMWLGTAAMVWRNASQPAAPNCS